MKCFADITDPNIGINGMQDGDLAQVIKWSTGAYLRGRVVQRHKNGLIFIGAPFVECWPNFFESNYTGIRVLLLKPGDQISISRE